MRHLHYDDRAGGRVPGYLPLGAYVRLLAGVLGAVAIVTGAWVGSFRRQVRRALLMGIPPENWREQIEALWAVELTGDPVRDTLAFAVSRLESPVVVWTVVAFGLLTLVLEYRRGRFDSVLEERD
ncbi:hypothetical protein OB920_03885 [Halobacteria archaeon HArc-gm2]|nr:hypothetical protein [Halobacteria archaeon HArc-gm2]